MQSMVSVKVPGIPVPEGSLRGWHNAKTGGVVLTHSNKDKLMEYRSRISQAVKAEAEAKGIKFRQDAPYIITVGFVFTKPKSAKKRIYCDVRPDLDKLTRAVGDALHGLCYADDAQIVAWHVAKVYTENEPYTTIDICYADSMCNVYPLDECGK